MSHYPCNIIAFNGKKPVVHSSAYMDPLARIIGDVTLEEDVVVLYGTILRGDDDKVLVREEAVILENSLVEAPKGFPVTIGRRALISHGAIVHGATIGEGALVGIGAIVLDGAVVGEEAIIAAGAVVPPGKEIPPRTLALGVPAKPVKELSESDLKKVREELEAVHRKAVVYRNILPRPC